MPTTPPTGGPNAPQGPHLPEEKNPVSQKGFKAKPMTFLGMYFDSENATKLWQSIIQTVNREIEKDKAKALEALRKLREDSQD